MLFLDQEEGFEYINRLGASKTPFFFLISFDKREILASTLDKLPKGVLFNLDGWTNSSKDLKLLKKTKISLINLPSYKEYLLSFNRVQEHISKGDTYLLNLTFSSQIKTDLSLEEIYHRANAPYKLYIKDNFTCFSPERFITIKDNKIFTYPMKGTIDASLPQAKEQILKDPKEMAEHIMITDLMRNDLNLVAKRVKVEEFRYIDKIPAGDKELYQVSSKISGELPSTWQNGIGSILSKITPAGSISGTPKKRTIEIIEEIENYKRGFYTGVFGVYREDELRSAVLIRFIEKSSRGLLYKSGGGITIDSDPLKEYKELISKIYLPTY